MSGSVLNLILVLPRAMTRACRRVKQMLCGSNLYYSCSRHVARKQGKPVRESQYSYTYRTCRQPRGDGVQGTDRCFGVVGRRVDPLLPCCLGLANVQLPPLLAAGEASPPFGTRRVNQRARLAWRVTDPIRSHAPCLPAPVACLRSSSPACASRQRREGYSLPPRLLSFFLSS